MPTPQETQKFIERTLANYFKAGGVEPIILVCSKPHEQYNMMALQALPENVIPIEVEDLPSIGIDTWFAALVNGATQVMFAASQRMPETIIRVLTAEVAQAQTLLEQLSLNKSTIEILYLESLRQGPPELITQDLGLRLVTCRAISVSVCLPHSMHWLSNTRSIRRSLPCQRGRRLVR
ncbi:iron-sulfur cluster-binding protein [Vibrio ishigakensis]|uniref:Iron-sulfur cluster-binding protein n=1 Tax=Vibrio ishigakensis TaxID=1481914 RepID=A0A0B8NZ98_9VIBR|nr:iron-sulfur cluster-binding protein [Vibrio ishigakensis]